LFLSSGWSFVSLYHWNCLFTYFEHLRCDAFHESAKFRPKGERVLWKQSQSLICCEWSFVYILDNICISCLYFYSKDNNSFCKNKFIDWIFEGDSALYWTDHSFCHLRGEGDCVIVYATVYEFCFAEHVGEEMSLMKHKASTEMSRIL